MFKMKHIETNEVDIIQGFFKLILINIIIFISIYLYTLNTMVDRQMSIAKPQYSELIATDLLICSILFLILTIVFNVKTIELNIYFLFAISMCIILSMNAKIFGWGYMPDHTDIGLDKIGRFFFPSGFYLVYLIVLKELTKYTIFILIPYFVTLSTIHKVSIKIISNIKAKI